MGWESGRVAGGSGVSPSLLLGKNGDVIIGMSVTSLSHSNDIVTLSPFRFFVSDDLSFDFYVDFFVFPPLLTI